MSRSRGREADLLYASFHWGRWFIPCSTRLFGLAELVRRSSTGSKELTLRSHDVGIFHKAAMQISIG
jgi:hypothetical protein